jgi:hypothetical protein
VDDDGIVHNVYEYGLMMNSSVTEIDGRRSTKDATILDMRRSRRGTFTQYDFYRMPEKQNLWAMPHSAYEHRIPDFV